VKVRKQMLHMVMLSTVFPGALGRAQTFNVRVLDALNGKPYNDIPVRIIAKTNIWKQRKEQ